MANINLWDLTKQWDSLDYAQQQAKLKANSKLQWALNSLWLTVKSAPTSTPTSTKQASNNAKVGTWAVAGINTQPTINAGTTQYKSYDYSKDQSINPNIWNTNTAYSTQYSTQNPKYSNTTNRTNTNAQYSTQNPKYAGVSSQNPKYTTPNNQYSTQNPKYTTNTPTATTNTSKNNNGNGSTYVSPSPKQQQRDYQDNSQARMNQIADNLDRYKITNPELFKDYDSFYNFFIDGKGRSADQIKFLDNWYANYKQNEKYNNMTPEEVGSGIANGTVPEDYINTASSTDPDRANAIKTALKDAQDWIANEWYLSELAGLSWFQAWNRKEMLYRDANNDWLDDRLYHEPTEEERKLVDENSELEAERLKLSNAMKDLQSDLTNQYPDADLSTIMLLTSDRWNKIQKSLDTLNVTQTKVQWTLKYLQTEREVMDKAGLNTISELQKNYGIYMEYSPEGIKERTKAEYEATNITLDQADSWDDTDKQMALDRVLQWYYDKYGSIIQRSKWQVINDVIAYAKKNWVTLSEALKKDFIEPLRAKPEFDRISSWQTTPEVTRIGTDSEGNPIYWYYDATTGTFLPADSWVWIWNGKFNKDTGVYNYEESWMKGKWLKNNNPWNIKDTGFWNVLWTDASWFAIFSNPEDWFDALVSKIKNVQSWWSKTYSPNMTLYEFFSKYAPSSDNNNPKAYAESVAKQLWTTATAKVSSVDATSLAAAIAKHDSWYNVSTYWMFRGNWAWNTASTTTSWASYDPNKASAYSQFLNESVTSRQKDIAKQYWMTESQFRAEADAYAEDRDARAMQPVIDAIDYILWLEQLPSKWDRSLSSWDWFGTKFYKTVTDDNISKWASKHNLIYNTVWMDKFLNLKSKGATFWALSDSEREAIYNAATDLDPTLWDDDYREALQNLREQIVVNSHWMLNWYWAAAQARKTNQITDSLYWDLY